MMSWCLWSSFSLSSAWSSSSLVALRAWGDSLGAPAGPFPSSSLRFATSLGPARCSGPPIVFRLPLVFGGSGLPAPFRQRRALPSCFLRGPMELLLLLCGSSKKVNKPTARPHQNLGHYS
eukprot:3659699-Heterocapsa_arctica.AAC.1